MLSRQRGNRGEIVEPADEHRADDAGRALGCQQRSQLRAGVLAEQHQPVGVDSKSAARQRMKASAARTSASESSNARRPPSR